MGSGPVGPVGSWNPLRHPTGTARSAHPPSGFQLVPWLLKRVGPLRGQLYSPFHGVTAGNFKGQLAAGLQFS
jgi:hypothetical protein